MRPRRLVPCFALAGALALLAATGAHAGFTDSIKKKMAEKASQKADKAVDKAIEGKPKPSSEPAEATEAAEAPAAKGGASGGGGASVATISTKFDFVPGDSVMLVDDFTQDELGEFPARWKLLIGTFEVAEMAGERWLRCTSNDGTIAFKRPPGLPEFWTLEFDFYATEPMNGAITVRGVGKGERTAWDATFPNGRDLGFRSGEIFSATPLEGVTSPAGRHHMMVMARGTALKVYLDDQRLANVPDVSEYAGMPDQIQFRLWATSHPMITNVRLAQGCKPAKDLLDTGKLVTYGIRFATGSDVVLPESAPILRQVAAYLTSHADVRLKITGHTDNVGTPASNLDLSKRRAAAVARVLGEQFGVAADRFATDGKGDTQALASNAKPEGRAMNRRVEFAKL